MLSRNLMQTATRRALVAGAATLAATACQRAAGIVGPVTLLKPPITYAAIGASDDAGDSARYLGMPAAQRRALALQWNEAIAGAVQAHDALLVDLFARWPVAQHPEYIGPDGLHPTTAGYRTLAGTFLTVLREQKVV